MGRGGAENWDGRSPSVSLSIALQGHNCELTTSSYLGKYINRSSVEFEGAGEIEKNDGSPHIADLQSARSRLIWELCTRFTTEIAAFMAAALIPEMAAALPEIAKFTMIRCKQHQHYLKNNW